MRYATITRISNYTHFFMAGKSIKIYGKATDYPNSTLYLAEKHKDNDIGASANISKFLGGNWESYSNQPLIDFSAINKSFIWLRERDIRFVDVENKHNKDVLTKL